MPALRQPSFPFLGTAYYPDAWPETQWRRDLEAIKAAGLKTVRWGEFSWSWWERSEGMYDFAATDRFVDLVGEVGLELVLCTPTATPPSWLIANHPDHLIVDQRGGLHRGGRHYGCHNHPGFLAKSEAIIIRLAERYRDRPHLVGWQIDNEVNLGECNQGRWYDYHPLTLAAWRRWLEERYGNIAALNEAWLTNFWSRAYGSFADVDAPRPDEGILNHSALIDWCRFRGRNLAGFIHWQRDLLRRHCPGVAVGTNIPDVNPLAMIQLGQDYWAQSEGLDWAGTDLYVFSKDSLYENRFLAYEMDLMRSALTHDGARFLVMETQAGPHNVPWRMTFVGGHFGPEFLERTSALYARHGAEGVCYFLWRPWPTGVEMGMNGIVDVDGSPTERSRAIPGIVERTRTILGEKPVKPPATLHYSQASLALCLGRDPDKTANVTLPGWHSVLNEGGRACSFVDELRLAERTWTTDDLLVLPYSLCLGADEVASVLRLLDAGGRVIAGWATGMLDQRGHLVAPRPIGLAERLGWRQVGADHLDEKCAWNLGGLKLTGNVSRIELLSGTTLLASDEGHPLLIRSPCGQAVSLTVDLGSLVWNRAGGVDRLASAVRTWLLG